MKWLDIFIKDMKLALASIKFHIAIFIVMPFLIAFISGMTFDKVFDPNRKLPEFTVAFIDQDNGNISAVLKNVLKSDNLSGMVKLNEKISLSDAKKSLIDGKLGAIIEVPEGFSKKVMTGANEDIKVYKSPASSVNGDIVENLVTAFTDNLSNSQSIYNAVISSGDNSVEVKTLAAQLSSEAAKIMSKDYIKEQQLQKQRKLNAKEYFSVSMLAMFSLFAAVSGAGSILKEKEENTLLRIRSTSITKGSYLLGKMVSAAAVALIQIGAFIIITGFVLKVSWASNMTGIIAMVIIHCLVVTGVIGICIAVFKSQKTMSIVMPFILMFMASLGGAYYPVENMGGSMETVSKFTLNYWLTEGYSKTLLGFSLNGILSDIAVMAAIGFVGIMFGSLLFKFEAGGVK